MGLGLIPQEISQHPVRASVKILAIRDVTGSMLIKEPVHAHRLGGFNDVPEMLLIVQLIEIAANDAPHLAGQLHGVGQHPVTGLLPVKLPCVVLPGAFQENVTLPKTVCPRGPGHPKQGLIHGLIAGGVPMDNAFVNVKVILISSIFQYLAGSHGFDVRLVRRVDLCTALALDGHFYLDQSCTGIFILHSRRFLVQTAGDHIGCVGTVDRQLGVHLALGPSKIFRFGW